MKKSMTRRAILMVTVVSALFLTLAVACPPSLLVTYDGNGSTGGTAPTDTNLYEEGAAVTVAGIGSLVRTGYTFAGWNTADDGSGTSYAAGSTFTMGSANVTLYAQWTPVPVQAIVGSWQINGTYDFYTEYPTIISQTIAQVSTYNSDGTLSASGSVGGSTLLMSGTYVYDPVAQTVDVVYLVFEMPVGTPQTPPVIPTSSCVIVGDTMTGTLTPGDYTWAEPLIYTRL